MGCLAHGHEKKKILKKNPMSMWKMKNCNTGSAWQWKLCLHDGRGPAASSAADKLEAKMCSHKCSPPPAVQKDTCQLLMLGRDQKKQRRQWDRKSRAKHTLQSRRVLQRPWSAHSNRCEEERALRCFQVKPLAFKYASVWILTSMKSCSEVT